MLLRLRSGPGGDASPRGSPHLTALDVPCSAACETGHGRGSCCCVLPRRGDLEQIPTVPALGGHRRPEQCDKTDLDVHSFKHHCPPALGGCLHGVLHPEGLPVLQGQHQQASSFPSLLPPTTQGHGPLRPQEAPQILHCGSLLWAQSCVLESEKPGLISWHPHFLTCLGASSSVSVKWDDRNSPRIIPGPGCRTSRGVSSTGVVLGHQRPSGSWRVGAVSSWLPALSCSAAPQTA